MLRHSKHGQVSALIRNFVILSDSKETIRVLINVLFTFIV